VHLDIHGISHLSELCKWGPTLFLELLQYRHGAAPLAGTNHAVAHHQRRRGANGGGADNGGSHRDLAHDSSGTRRIPQSRKLCPLKNETQIRF